MKILFYIALMLCLAVLPSNATNLQTDSLESLKQQADSAYSKEDFADAEKMYLQLASNGESVSVFYNLACSYYRMNDIPKAILWFERAALLDPSDDDIRFNLAMARSKTIDRIIPRHENFFVSSWHSIMQTSSVSEWAYYALFSFAVTLMFLGVYMFCQSVLLRKIGFFGALVFLFGCVLFNLLALSVRSQNNNKSSAIIMAPAVTVRSTPTQSGTDLFLIHEGTKVEIRDNSISDWAEIQIADGKVGWVEKSTFETI